MPPPTMAPPSQAPAPAIDSTATAKPAPVSKIAATSESPVSAMLYAVGTPGENANIAMKCVAQTPKPVEIAETASQARRISPLDLRTWWSRLMAVYEANAHITAAKPTSRKSCCVTIQLNTAYIWSSSRIETDSYGGISTYGRVLKSAAFGPREFESKFHKKL